MSRRSPPPQKAWLWSLHRWRGHKAETGLVRAAVHGVESCRPSLCLSTQQLSQFLEQEREAGSSCSVSLFVPCLQVILGGGSVFSSVFSAFTPRVESAFLLCPSLSRCLRVCFVFMRLRRSSESTKPCTFLCWIRCTSISVHLSPLCFDNVCMLNFFMECDRHPPVVVQRQILTFLCIISFAV